MPKNKKLWLLVAVSLLGGFLITRVSLTRSVFTRQGQWTTIAFQNVPLKVQFPFLPRHRVEQVSLRGASHTVTQGIFIASDPHGVVYALNVITYPIGTLISDHELMVKAELARLMPGAGLVSLASATVSGWEARNFVMQNSADGTEVQGRILKKDDVFYVLSVIYPGGYFPKEAYNRFINSFSYAQ